MSQRSKRGTGDPGGGGEIGCQGNVRRDGKPFVQTSVRGEPFGQLDIPEAIALGVQFISAAIEAERDAGFILWSMEEMGVEPYAASVMLTKIRDHRQHFDIGHLIDRLKEYET